MRLTIFGVDGTKRTRVGARRIGGSKLELGAAAMGTQAFITPLLSFRRVANTPTREGVSPQKTGQHFTLLNLFQNSRQSCVRLIH